MTDRSRSIPAPFAASVTRIVSGGQTGADRAALDWAIAHGIAHGGWCPHGRLAEDGAVPARYALTEMSTGSYRERTRQNVIDSDGTLILNLGELADGTLLTLQFAEELRKPCFVAQLDAGAQAATALEVNGWLHAQRIATLNVAGPRESKRPGMHAAATAFLNLLAR